MKGTNYIFILLSLLLLSGCDQDDQLRYSNSNGNFVRFFFMVDPDNKPLEYPAIEPGIPSQDSYVKDNLASRTLKIPVALTATPLSQPVEVSFSTQISGLTNIDITPSNVFTFAGSQVTDTLYVTFNEPWDTALNPNIKFELTDSSLPDLDLGMPNATNDGKSFEIGFQDFEYTYQLGSPSRIDVVGDQGEQHIIQIEFPNGFNPADVDGVALLQETQSNYNYTLTQLPINSDTTVEYLFEIASDFTANDILYKTSFALNQLPGYNLSGLQNISLIRDLISPRDVTLNTAAQFYDTSNPFYRIYGLNWMDFNEDGICEWRDFNTFSIPIEVPENDPNAILGNDMGTTDPSDDIYYHAFRIGFLPPTTNTTNSFNLRRWFTNESTSASISPGFNVVPALEFYPDNGTSATSGQVQVIEQTIQIGTTASNGGVTEFITISGSGTYTQISPGVFDIELTFNATNNRLFGGTRVAKYHFYNTNSFTDPALLTESCFTPIAL